MRYLMLLAFLAWMVAMAATTSGEFASPPQIGSDPSTRQHPVCITDCCKIPTWLCRTGPAALQSALYINVPQEQEAAGAIPAPPRKLCAATSHIGNQNHSTSEEGQQWSCQNWAGTVTWSPRAVIAPASEVELAEFLQRSSLTSSSSSNNNVPRSPLKVVGFAHSWAGLYTPARAADGSAGITLALHKLSGITKVSQTHVEVLAGTSFAQLYQELDSMGLTLAWSPGGIQGLTVGGAASVGFHGSQQSVGGVSSVVRAVRVYDTAGNVHELDDSSHPQAMKAARMGLGMCGILSRVTLPVTAQFHLRRRRWRLDDAAEFLTQQLPGLKETYDRFHWWVRVWECQTQCAAAATSLTLH